MSWWQVSVEVPAEMAETVAWLVAEQTGAGVEIRDADTFAHGSSPEVAELVAGFNEAPDPSVPAIVTGCLTVLGIPDQPVKTRRNDDDSWMEGWRAFFRGMRLSDRVWVGPPWETPDDAEAKVVIDPGLAFGTGNHPTTRGVLKVLDGLLCDRPETTVLDVGAGSAILSMAAALLGHRAIGVEVDAVALRNAEENLELSGVQDRVTLLHGSADAVEGTYDIVLANILAPILIEIAPQIRARAADHLVLSGLIPKQWDDVRAAYPDFDVAQDLREDDWVVLHLRRRREEQA